MKIKVKIHDGSSQEKIEKISNDLYEVWIRKKPVEGKANVEMIKVLKKYFNKEVKIVLGLTSREKIVEIGDCILTE
ncbi:MAG TPA: DUF167 domain-containing protein [Candidatus Nanoarchaeia archaeon]|nr:DUF167 domain-containing protein [Candidatus Nanoarchaeia archaeon]